MVLEHFCAILLGTTASGKSELASELANSCVLLSADSMCVYKELSIISAKPSGEYFGVDLKSINEAFNVGEWLAEYERAKNHAKEQNKPLLIVGGSSFYLAALLNGLSDKVAPLENYPSNDEIFALKERVDKNSKICAQDTYRLRRWLEIYTHSKIAPSKFLANSKKPPLLDKNHAAIFELCWEKSALNERINIRSQNMLAKGAISECARALNLINAANFAQNKALNCIGAKQICQMILQECENGFSEQNILQTAQKIEQNPAALANLAEQISIKTRQYAKRQRTFNRSLGATRLDAGSNQNANIIKKALKI